MFSIRPNQLHFELFAEFQKLNFGGSILIAFEKHLLGLDSQRIPLYAYPIGFSWGLRNLRTIACFFDTSQYYCGLKCLLRKFVRKVLTPLLRSCSVAEKTSSKRLTNFD